MSELKKITALAKKTNETKVFTVVAMDGVAGTAASARWQQWAVMG
jgi:hypothetical protein